MSNKILIQEVDAIRRNMQRVNPREQRERPQDLHVDIVMVLEFGVMIALVSLVLQLLYNIMTPNRALLDGLEI